MRLKKQFLLPIALAVFVFFSCNIDKNAKTYFYHIKGERISSQSDSVFLFKAGDYLGYTYEKIGASKIENGKFRFDGEFNHAEMYFIGMSNQPNIPIYIDSEDIFVEGNLEKPEEFEVNGAMLNEQLKEIEVKLKLVDDSQQELEMIDAFIQSEPDSPLNPYLILNYRYHTGNFEELNHLYYLMDLSLRTHPYSEKVKLSNGNLGKGSAR